MYAEDRPTFYIDPTGHAPETLGQAARAGKTITCNPDCHVVDSTAPVNRQSPTAVHDESTNARYEQIEREAAERRPANAPDASIVIEDGQETEKDYGPIGNVVNPIIDKTGEAIDKVKGPVDRYIGEKADAGAEKTREWVEAQKSPGILGDRSKTAKDVGLRDPTSELGQRATEEAADIAAEGTRRGIENAPAVGAAGIIRKIGGGGGTKLAPATKKTTPPVVTRKIPRHELKYRPSARGRAPIGADGKPVELHHADQSLGNASAREELTRTEHRGPGTFRSNHPNTGQKPSTVDRKESSKQHSAHWARELDAGEFDDLPDPPKKK